MRQKSGSAKQPAEDAIKDIRRATRRHFSAGEKIRIVAEGLRGEESMPSSAAARASPRRCIMAGRKSSWRPAKDAGGAERIRTPDLGTRAGDVRPNATRAQAVIGFVP